MRERLSQSEMESDIKEDLLKVEEDGNEKQLMVGNFSNRVTQNDEGETKMEKIVM